MSDAATTKVQQLRENQGLTQKGLAATAGLKLEVVEFVEREPRNIFLTSPQTRIGFKGKAYHLGTYDKLEDAVAARKEAEQRYFGEFLEWYNENYQNGSREPKSKE